MKDTAIIMKQEYIKAASQLKLGDFTKVKTGKARVELINKVADMYCNATDTNNETLRNQTISALMLLFYGEINKMQQKCIGVSTLDYMDFASKLYECIEVACKYRAWLNGKTTAEACIRSTIASRGAAAILYDSNLAKNKANANTLSLDSLLDSDDSDDKKSSDWIEYMYGNAQDDVDTNGSKSLIQSLIEKNKIVEAIMLDRIAFGDTCKETKNISYYTDDDGNAEKYTNYGHQFMESRLIKALNSLPVDYAKHFSTTYEVRPEILTAGITAISKSNSKKLYTAWEKLKSYLLADSDLLSLLVK